MGCVTSTDLPSTPQAPDSHCIECSPEYPDGAERRTSKLHCLLVTQALDTGSIPVEGTTCKAGSFRKLPAFFFFPCEKWPGSMQQHAARR